MNVNDLPDQLRSKISVQDDGCWHWTASTSGDGYPKIKWDRRDKRAHRVIFEILIGTIPDGLTLDHLCRVRNCVNPAHLEPVTVRENLMRGRSFAATNAAKTHCVHGHEFTPKNTYIRTTGRRACRQCHAFFCRAARRAVEV